MVILNFKFQQDIIVDFNKNKVQELATHYSDFKDQRLDSDLFHKSKIESIVIYDRLTYKNLMWGGLKQIEGGSLKVHWFACIHVLLPLT